MDSRDLQRTPLHAWHAEHGGRMVDFAGWSMPVQYFSIVAEHQATRSAVGLFDVSHMGRLRFDGPDAAKFLDSLVTRRVADLPVGRIRYGLVTNEQGGILDDVLVYRLDDDRGPYFQMVVNASNREKIVAWLRSHVGGAQVTIADQTVDTAMIAVQGPRAVELARSLLDVDLGAMKYYTGAHAQVAGRPGIVSRTGYTGEDGCELIVPAADALPLWETLIERGQLLGAMPAGLASRDTLRLEAAMPLYGHELSESINPVQAGLEFAWNLKDREFIGRAAIEKFLADPAQPKRVGLVLVSRRVPRQECLIYRADEPVGTVTSGTFSPTLERPIAMGYVESDCARPATELVVDIRGQREPATVVPLPFYHRAQ